MTYDVLIVGGGFAGLSAAMQLARAQRLVLLVDAGQPRNRFAHASHGFLGQDGAAPADIVRKGLAQLAVYPAFTHVQGTAIDAQGGADDFHVRLDDGRAFVARRLILAAGVVDALPLASMAPRWGVSVLHCPYCHGYEARGRRLGAIAVSPRAVHQALLLPDWGPTTYFTQGAFEPTPEEAAQLAARGVEIERTPVVELLGAAPETQAVRLADGRTTPVEAIFTGPRTTVATPLAEQLGCAFEEGPSGPFIAVGPSKETSVPGVFAAGDAAQPMHNATLASAAGVLAGVSAHRSLVMAEAAAPQRANL